MIDRLKNTSIILWIAIVVSLLTYMGWKPIKDYYGFQIFYIGMSVFIFLLSLYIWKISFRHSVPEFVLFVISLNNLIDELFYDPTKFEANEIIFFIIVVVYSIKLRSRCKIKKKYTN